MCSGTVYARGKVYVFMVIEYDVESTSSDRRVKSSNPKYLKAFLSLNSLFHCYFIDE